MTKREDGFWFVQHLDEQTIVEVKNGYVWYLGCEIEDNIAQFEKDGGEFLAKVIRVEGLKLKCKWCGLESEGGFCSHGCISNYLAGVPKPA